MNYVEKKNYYRRERDNYLRHDVEMFKELIRRFLELEKALIESINKFNREYIYKHKKQRFYVYAKFQCFNEQEIKFLNSEYLTEASAQFKGVDFNQRKSLQNFLPSTIKKKKFIPPQIIKQINFEFHNYENKPSKKYYIGTGYRWTRNINRYVKEKNINTTITTHKLILTQFKQYKKLAKLIEDISQTVIDFKCKDNLQFSSWLNNNKLSEHLPKKVLDTASMRLNAFTEIERLIQNTQTEFHQIENQCDEKIKWFNYLNHYHFGGLAFSWKIISNRKSSIKKITGLMLYRIICPIDNSGKRSRYKLSIKDMTLTRDYLRQIRMKRFHKKILARSREIQKLANEYLDLKNKTYLRHKLLKEFSKSINGCYIEPIDC
ncbi:MAG: hypothetical protein HQL46_12320 [Gammaproteobacteria bacterium]|nr:hypothetical protein [Gammaproteobacteria bacterium]